MDNQTYANTISHNSDNKLSDENQSIYKPNKHNVCSQIEKNDLIQQTLVPITNKFNVENEENFNNFNYRRAISLKEETEKESKEFMKNENNYFKSYYNDNKICNKTRVNDSNSFISKNLVQNGESKKFNLESPQDPNLNLNFNLYSNLNENVYKKKSNQVENSCFNFINENEKYNMKDPNKMITKIISPAEELQKKKVALELQQYLLKQMEINQYKKNNNKEEDIIKKKVQLSDFEYPKDKFVKRIIKDPFQNVENIEKVENIDKVESNKSQNINLNINKNKIKNTKQVEVHQVSLKNDLIQKNNHNENNINLRANDPTIEKLSSLQNEITFLNKIFKNELEKFKTPNYYEYKNTVNFGENQFPVNHLNNIKNVKNVKNLKKILHNKGNKSVENQKLYFRPNIQNVAKFQLINLNNEISDFKYYKLPNIIWRKENCQLQVKNINGFDKENSNNSISYNINNSKFQSNGNCEELNSVSSFIKMNKKGYIFKNRKI